MKIKIWTSFAECEQTIRPFLESQKQSPFLNFDWLQMYWKHYCELSSMKLLLTGVFDGEKLITMAPLNAQKRLFGVWEIGILGDGYSDYLGFAGETNSKILQAIIDELECQFSNILFKFNDISENNPLSKVLEEQTFLKRHTSIPLFACPYWDMAIATQKKISSSRKKFQSRIRGSLRKLENLGNFECVVLDFDKDRDTALEMFTKLFSLHKIRHHGTMNAWLKPENLNFLKDFIQNSVESNIIAFISLLDGNPIVFELGFRQNGIFILYIPAFHPAFARFRLGHVNRYLSFQHCEKMGIQVYDFSKGDRPDKRYWSNGIKSNYIHLFINKVTPANIFLLLKTSIILRAKVWSREKGINHRVKQNLGFLAKLFRKNKPENINHGKVQESSQVEGENPFRFEQVSDLPMKDQLAVMDFIFQHGNKEKITCQRFSNYLLLNGEGSEIELKVILK
jgi:CelD/BcsL family acetyltransferase involved in cellulose biosynthesis